MRDVAPGSVAGLLSSFGLQFEQVAASQDIPGSYWGDDEAGLIGDRILARTDTPLHSILHEACHYICLDPQRRHSLHTDAGGDYDEENGVCYLQILLANHIGGFGKQRMFEDMDNWGYTFRLGSAQAWFEQDADDARAWLQKHSIIGPEQQITWKLRGHSDK